MLISGLSCGGAGSSATGAGGLALATVLGATSLCPHDPSTTIATTMLVCFMGSSAGDPNRREPDRGMAAIDRVWHARLTPTRSRGLAITQCQSGSAAIRACQTPRFAGCLLHAY